MQPSLAFDLVPRHDGPFLIKSDHARLGKQLALVREAMAGGAWMTLATLSAYTGAPEASVSARVRDLRKSRHGSYEIERKRVGNQFFYRMVR